MGHTTGSDATVAPGVGIEAERREATGEIFTLLFQMGDSLKQRVLQAAEERGLGLAHLGLLHVLSSSQRKPCRMGALAQELGYDASHITAVVDRLEELGLVERRADPDDRRVRLIHPTPAGLVVVADLERELIETDEVFVHLTVAECRQIRDLLGKAVDGYTAAHPVE